METLAPIAMLAFVIFTLVSLARYVRGGDWNGAITLVVAWVIGVVACWLFGESNVGETLVIPGFSTPLGDMNFADLLLAGLVSSSTATAYNEVTGAIDGHRSTAKPHLVDDSSGDTTTETVVVNRP